MAMKNVFYVSKIILLLLFLVISIDGITGYLVRDRIYTEAKDLPNVEYGVILGTSKYYATGTPNLYYKYRLDAAVDLLKQGKINKLLVSGDNKTPYYNEPKVMTNDLRRMGVQKKQIEQDFAGYRTLDSIIRAKEVYHLSPFIIITQRFHCERALFIAKYHHIDAVCFVAKYPEGHLKVRLREFFARIGMLWDLMLGVMPETLEKVEENVMKN